MLQVAQKYSAVREHSLRNLEIAPNDDEPMTVPILAIAFRRLSSQVNFNFEHITLTYVR